MFIADMIAPCGLDCSICKRALAESGRYAGCRGPNDNKPEFCSERCGIILCEKRKANGNSFCDECPDFPCADIMERRPGTDRSTRSANPRWKICGSSGRRGWPLFWSASGNSGPVLPAEASSVSTQVCAAVVAGSTPVQWKGHKTYETGASVYWYSGGSSSLLFCSRRSSFAMRSSLRRIQANSFYGNRHAD